MERISKHISYKEATFSPTAIRLGIKNTPNKFELDLMKKVAENVFEPLREWYGKPIKINSFFRCEALNKAVKGSKTSQHRYGEAIDIDANEDNFKIALWIKQNLDFDQLIIEGVDDERNIAWIHISYTTKDRNRNKVLIMKDNIYYPFETHSEKLL